MSENENSEEERLRIVLWLEDEGREMETDITDFLLQVYEGVHAPGNPMIESGEVFGIRIYFWGEKVFENFPKNQK